MVGRSLPIDSGHDVSPMYCTTLPKQRFVNEDAEEEDRSTNVDVS